MNDKTCSRPRAALVRSAINALADGLQAAATALGLAGAHDLAMSAEILAELLHIAASQHAAKALHRAAHQLHRRYDCSADDPADSCST